MEKAEPKEVQDFMFECDECGKLFSYTRDMLEHCRLQMSKKPYKCTNCRKGFSQSTNLQKHTDNKVFNKEHYKCQDCGKALKSKITLVEHKRIHTGEKPYTCGHCGKKFSHKTTYWCHTKHKVCTKVKLKVLEDQIEDQRDYLANPEFESRPLTSEEFVQVAENIRPTAIINPQSSQDLLFHQQSAQPGSSQDQSFFYVQWSGHSEGAIYIYFQQEQGDSSLLDQYSTHFYFLQDFLNQQTVQTDPLSNQQTAQADLYLNQQTVQADLHLNQQTVQADLHLNQQTAQADSNLNQQTAQADYNLNQQTAQADYNLNQQTAQSAIPFNQQTAQHTSQFSQQTLQPNSSQDKTFSSCKHPKDDGNINLQQGQGDSSFLDEDRTHFYFNVFNDILNSSLCNKQTAQHVSSFIQQTVQPNHLQDQPISSFAHSEGDINIQQEQVPAYNNSLLQTKPLTFYSELSDYF